MKKVLFLISFSIILCNSFAQMESLLIGKKDIVQVKICRTNVKWNEISKIHHEYTPPVNWQIVSFKPIPVLEKGKVSYQLSTVCAAAKSKVTANIAAKFIELLELASEKNLAGKYDSVIIKMRNDYEKSLNTADQHYSKIITTGSVSGSKENSRKTGGALYLDLKVVIMYMPETEDQLLQSLEYFKEAINSEN